MKKVVIALLVSCLLAGGIADAQTASESPGNTAAVGDDQVLPRSQGQVFRRYDLRPYTGRIDSNLTPQQAVIDWILRETGTATWFNEPLGFFSASRETLTVYHTPAVQRVVSELVDRLVHGVTEEVVLDVRLARITSPSWRVRAQPMMRPVSVSQPGVEAWIVSRENATVLYNTVARRADFRESISRSLTLENGQTHTFVQRTPRRYLRTVRNSGRSDVRYESVAGEIQEGHQLELSCLVHDKQKTLDLFMKCRLDQVERFFPLAINVPSGGNQQSRLQVQVPQVSGWQCQERFRWPQDHVLVVSFGVVPVPGPAPPTSLGIPNPFSTRPGRADAVMFVEYKGLVSDRLLEERTAKLPAVRR